MPISKKIIQIYIHNFVKNCYTVAWSDTSHSQFANIVWKHETYNKFVGTLEDLQKIVNCNVY